MSEIDLDPSFKYLQANQQRAFAGIQIGQEIAARKQMMEMRLQEFKRKFAQDEIRKNLMEAQAARYNQLAADDLLESEALRNEAEPMAQWMSKVNATYSDPTGKTPFPDAPQVLSKSNQGIIRQVQDNYRLQSPLALAQKRESEEIAKTAAFISEQKAKELERARAVEARFPEAKIINYDDFSVNRAALAKYEPVLNQELRDLEAAKALGVGARGEALKSMQASGRYSEELIQALEQSAGGTETIRQRHAKAYADAIRNRNEQRGLKVDEDRLQKVQERILATGNVQPMPAQQLSNMSAKFGVMELMDEFLDGVKQWEKDFPGKKFEDNLGIIPRTARELSSFLQKETDPAKVKAIELLVPFGFAQNTELRTTSGATVTPQEANRLAVTIGSQFDKNTLTKLKAFRKSYEKGLRKDIAIYDGYYIPEFFQDFAVAKPKPGQETVNVLEFVSERTGMQPSGIQVPAGSTNTIPGQSRVLDPSTARQILQEAGGDKERARALARERGYSF